VSALEQAQVYLAQGSTCRAASICKRLVDENPSTENLLMLAEVYMQQGLHEDAIDLHLRAVKGGRIQ
jgi:Tfp pilus assembly protein PilF